MYIYLCTLLMCFSIIDCQNIVNETTVAQTLSKILDSEILNDEIKPNESVIKKELKSEILQPDLEPGIDHGQNKTNDSAESSENINEIESKIVARKGVAIPLPSTDRPSVSARKGVSLPSSVIARKGVALNESNVIEENTTDKSEQLDIEDVNEKINIGNISVKDNPEESDMKILTNVSKDDILIAKDEKSSKSVEYHELNGSVSDKNSDVEGSSSDEPEEIDETSMDKSASSPDIYDVVNQTSTTDVLPLFDLIPTTKQATKANVGTTQRMLNFDGDLNRPIPPTQENITPGVIKEPVVDKASGKHFRSTSGYGAIAVTVLILLSMMLILGFVGYKRLHAFWYRRHYARVDFLIDGMYE